MPEQTRSRAGAAAAGDSNLAGAHHLKGRGKSFIFQLASCDHFALVTYQVFARAELLPAVEATLKNYERWSL